MEKCKKSIWYQHPSTITSVWFLAPWWSSIADEFLIASERSCERAVSGSRQRACAYGVGVHWFLLSRNEWAAEVRWSSTFRPDNYMLSFDHCPGNTCWFCELKNRRFWSLSRSRDRHFVLAAIALLDCGKMATTGNSSRRKASKRPAAAATEPTTNGLVQPSDLVAPATKKSKTETSRAKAKKENEGNIWLFYCFQLTF